jgi:serine/threonine protein kinase
MDVDLEAQNTPLLRLPAEDRQWLAECGFRLLVPLVSQDGLLVGLIGLGQKKSDLPFSADDRHLLGAIAASGAMALDRFRLRTPHAEPPGVVTGAVTSEDAASECRACGLVLDAALGTCPSCSGPAVTAPVPRVLRGTFQFEKRLGVGGMGVVYRATDLTLGRVVAVKTLPALSPERVMRLRREAFAMAAVSHPHLATIFGAEMWRGTPLLIVEYLDGGTLADRLREGWLPVAEVIDLGIAIAGAVGRLHAQGLLHRDVKPSNIGFSSQAGPKLLDFGLAKFLRPPGAPAGDGPGQSSPTASFAVTSSGEVTRALAGTPLYFSPETVRQEPADAGVDLWALALVLFEALTAIHPMRAPTLIEVFERISRGPVPDPRQLRPACPAPLASFLAAALHVDPARRPRSAREFQAGLEAVRARTGA